MCLVWLDTVTDKGWLDRQIARKTSPNVALLILSVLWKPNRKVANVCLAKASQNLHVGSTAVSSQILASPVQLQYLVHGGDSKSLEIQLCCLIK